MPDLPLELITLISSNLDAKKDQKALKNLCLASSRFLQPCQSILFNHICLVATTQPSPDTKTPGGRLLNVLESSPHLIHYTHEVTVSDCEFYSSWLPNDTKLAEALNKLNADQIKSFSLYRSFRAKWFLLCREVKEALVRICRSPSLERLAIRRSPLSLLGVCAPSLKHFEARDAEAREDVHLAPIPRVSDVVLDSLRLYHPHDLDYHVRYLLEPQSQIRLQALQKLDVIASIRGDHGHLSTLLHACQGSLRILTFEPCTDIDGRDATQLLDISQCTSLELLELCIDATASDLEGERQAFRWASASITRIPSSNILKTLRLSLKFDLSDVPGELTGPASNEIYHHVTSIGNVICTPARFPRLSAVEVEIESSNPNDDDTEEIRKFVWDALRIHCAGRNLVTLKTLPHTIYGGVYAALY